MASILILYSTIEGHTARIANHLAEAIRNKGHVVDVIHIDDVSADFTLRKYDATIIGASIHIGKHPESVVTFVQYHLTTLQHRPTAFFSVSLTARREDERGKTVVAEYINRFQRETGWQPTRIATFAGALLFSRYGFFKRLMMLMISKMTGGETDMSRDYEYTDWDAVTHFGEEFAELLSGNPQLSP